ncbi:hypothetical protein ABZ835_48190 [Streptomyces sp. NPDC047461]|uniref:hypothetical protein n=1 Tax=Streptomyces sp. NPDC047461 TaxID=3155619 RepID=UPI0033C24520
MRDLRRQSRAAVPPGCDTGYTADGFRAAAEHSTDRPATQPRAAQRTAPKESP